MMKKTFVLFASMMALAFANVACIKDGDLPPETPDAAVPPTQPDACPTPPMVDATVTPTVDAMVPVVDASAPTPDATVPVPDAATPPPVDASVPTPDATPLAPDASCPPPAAPTLSFTATPTTITVGGSSTLSWSTTGATSCALGGGSPNGTVVVTPIITTTFSTTCFGPGGSVSAWVTITVNPAPAPVICHGQYNYYSAAQLAVMDHCTGYPISGSGVTLTPALEVVGGDGVCSITCNRLVTGETMVPIAVSGVWVPGATADVPRWYTTGCTRLPDHPVDEADQAGGAWDGRCDHPVLPLSGPPTP